MKLELTNDQAPVLFELLARLDERDAFPVEDPAEEQGAMVPARAARK